MRLIEIDLTSAVENTHPDIKLDRWYFAEIQFSTDKESFYVTGKFVEQWYGLFFDCNWANGIQFDAPGYNYSPWKKLWLIDRRDWTSTFEKTYRQSS